LRILLHQQKDKSSLYPKHPEHFIYEVLIIWSKLGYNQHDDRLSKHNQDASSSPHNSLDTPWNSTSTSRYDQILHLLWWM